jgi:hypothetical protein
VVLSPAKITLDTLHSAEYLDGPSRGTAVGDEDRDHSQDVDIVELALAVLDEELTAWVRGHRPAPSRSGAAPADDSPGEDR